MSYKRKPNYHFADKLQTGLDNVPKGRMVICEDYNGEVKLFVYNDTTSVDNTTTIEQAVIANNLVVDTIGIDALPTDGSTNAVSSNGVFDSVATVASNLSTLDGTVSGLVSSVGTVDTIPTDGSTNPVQSNGVFDAIDSIYETGTITTTPVGSSGSISTPNDFTLSYVRVGNMVTVGFYGVITTSGLATGEYVHINVPIASSSSSKHGSGTLSASNLHYEAAVVRQWSGSEITIDFNVGHAYVTQTLHGTFIYQL